MKIVPLTLRVANDFVEKWHRHSARTNNDGGKFAIGLEQDGQLVGCAIVGRPVARLLQVDGAAELTRLCLSPTAPKGSGSKLYARCKRIWQLMGGTTIHTYTLKKEGGETMRGVGFRDDDAIEVAQQQWSRPSRKRDERAIYQDQRGFSHVRTQMHIEQGAERPNALVPVLDSNWPMHNLRSKRSRTIFF